MQATMRTAAPAPETAALRELSDADVKLLRNAVLNQIQATESDTEILLLGGVWRQMEQELRRRESEVLELQQMYFAK